MNIRIVKLDLSDTNEQLRRIADALEGILGATDPIPVGIDSFPEDNTIQRAFYTNDSDEIISHKLSKLGKEYKKRTVPE